MNIHEQEEAILKFWKKNKIFEQSVEKPAGKKPKKNYVFYDGPPFITGLPHYGSILPSIVKDAVPRFWTMNGFRVERIWGWDCHGLPAENKVEKQLELKNKKDIEKLGIDKFVCACKDYVKTGSDQWEWYIDKIARWVDFKKSYKTMDKEFMESVIWAFKELYDKGLIYEGTRSSLHCPRCATPLSKFEVTMDAGSYKDVTEQSVVIKFKLKNSSKFHNEDVNILAWTTTPWTLPGNFALAVGKKIKYVLIKSKGENFILAKEKLNEIFKDKEFTELKEISGKDLVGLEYEPLFELPLEELKEDKNVYHVFDADFVNTEEGTGIVHIAPNFGEDDFEFGKKNKLPEVELMDENGVYTENAGKFKGFYFKEAGKAVMKELGDSLFDKFNYTHSYPFCYRCETPLIYKTQKAWYLDIDKIRDSMLKTNEKINWVPDYFKEGRFKYNLENAPHWCLSRSRYWGSPIPVWKCESCGEFKVAGSIEEIEKLSGKKVTDLHRPEIDKHEFKCSCGGKMKRVPEVFDCWFESGSMPFAQFHYPFERKQEWKNLFPSDFIIEYTGQLRGWFYYLHVLSNALFKSESFKNVMVTGVLAGNDGRKMSKSYGNYPDPKETLEKYGGDAMRMYFLGSPIIIGGDMNIAERDIQDSFRKNVMLLQNVFNFYESLNLKKVEKVNSKNNLDLWILSRLNEVVKIVTEEMEKYDVPLAARSITEFIDNLSTWYVRLSRDRLNSFDKEALSTFKEVLDKFVLVVAPFMPYLSEYLFQKLSENNFKKKDTSVHLEAWPKFDEKKINEKLLEKMKLVREIVSLGLKERDQNGFGLKWPLAKVEIESSKLEKEFLELIKSELNVKETLFKENEKIYVKLDFNLTPELEAEGFAREVSRNVQAFRKKLGLEKQDLIQLILIVDEEFKKILDSQIEFVRERTNSKSVDIVTTSKERFKNKTDFKVKGKKGVIAIANY